MPPSAPVFCSEAAPLENRTAEVQNGKPGPVFCKEVFNVLSGRRDIQGRIGLCVFRERTLLATGSQFLQIL